MVIGYASRIGPLKIETEDNADIVIRHSSGAVSNIHIDYLRREYLCTCEVVGTEGIVMWDFSRRSTKVYQASTAQWIDHAADIPSDINTMYVDEVAHFLDCVERGVQPSNSIEDAGTALNVVLELKERMSL